MGLLILNNHNHISLYDAGIWLTMKYLLDSHCSVLPRTLILHSVKCSLHQGQIILLHPWISVHLPMFEKNSRAEHSWQNWNRASINIFFNEQVPFDKREERKTVDSTFPHFIDCQESCQQARLDLSWLLWRRLISECFPICHVDIGVVIILI